MICLVQKGNDGRNRSVDQENHIAEQECKEDDLERMPVGERGEQT